MEFTNLKDYEYYVNLYIWWIHKGCYWFDCSIYKFSEKAFTR